MPACSAFGCKSKAGQGIVMKRFPTDKLRRATWALNVQKYRKNWEPHKNSFLCEKHFDANQWEKVRTDGSKKLKWNAVPTLFGSYTEDEKKRPKISLNNNYCNDVSKIIIREHLYSVTIDSNKKLNSREDENQLLSDEDVIIFKGEAETNPPIEDLSFISKCLTVPYSESGFSTMDKKYYSEFDNILGERNEEIWNLKQKLKLKKSNYRSD